MFFTSHATRLTRYGEINPANRKPYFKGPKGDRKMRRHDEATFNPTRAHKVHYAGYLRACGKDGVAVIVEHEIRDER